MHGKQTSQKLRERQTEHNQVSVVVVVVVMITNGEEQASNHEACVF